MKASKSSLSDKDLQLFGQAYRILIEVYNDQSSEQNSTKMIALNNLTMSIIQTPQQSHAIMVLSRLEMLKIRTKSNKELWESIKQTITHLKNPTKKQLKQETLNACFEIQELYDLISMVILRLYASEMKESESYDWKPLIYQICQNCGKNMQNCLELLNLILPKYKNQMEQIGKSGLVDQICFKYLPKVLKQKNRLYEALKVLKIVAANDNTVLLQRETNISKVIYNHSRYLIIIKQITDACFDKNYCQKLWNPPLRIDAVYVWSFNQQFIQMSTQNCVQIIEEMLDGSSLSEEEQWKLYSILYNISKSHPKLLINRASVIPNHASRNLNIFLKLAISSVENNNENFKKIDIQEIEKVYDKSGISDPVSEQFIKQLKVIELLLYSKKTGHVPLEFLQSSQIKSRVMFREIEKNENSKDNKLQSGILSQLQTKFLGQKDTQEIVNPKKDQKQDPLKIFLDIFASKEKQSGVISQNPFDFIMALASQKHNQEEPVSLNTMLNKVFQKTAQIAEKQFYKIKVKGLTGQQWEVQVRFDDIVDDLAAKFEEKTGLDKEKMSFMTEERKVREYEMLGQIGVLHRLIIYVEIQQ